MLTATEPALTSLWRVYEDQPAQESGISAKCHVECYNCLLIKVLQWLQYVPLPVTIKC